MKKISEDMKIFLKSIIENDFQPRFGRRKCIGRPIWIDVLDLKGEKLYILMSAGISKGLIGRGFEKRKEDQTIWITKKGYDLIMGQN
jgi:hypothetical protein